MVRTILRLEQNLDSADAADALALAICHANAARLRARIEEAERAQ
ncbi:MAG: crossover junction endodeoxyribonuclease RuvC [Actinomycetota bacterium]